MAARELGTILPALWPPWPSVGVGAGASCWAATGAARRESAAKAGSTPSTRRRGRVNTGQSVPKPQNVETIL